MTEEETAFARKQLAKHEKAYEENEREYQASGMPSYYKAYKKAECWTAVIRTALDAADAVQESRARTFRNISAYADRISGEKKEGYTKEEVLKIISDLMCI